MKEMKKKMSGIQNEGKVFLLIFLLLLSVIFPRDTFNMNVNRMEEMIINVLISSMKYVD